MTAKWEDFIRAGDEYLYAIALIMPNADLFQEEKIRQNYGPHIYHSYFQTLHNALENYLKGYLFYVSNDFQKVKATGHKLLRLVGDVRAIEPDFVSWLEIKEKSEWKEIEEVDLYTKDPSIHKIVYGEYRDFYDLVRVDVHMAHRYRGLDKNGNSLYRYAVWGFPSTIIGIIREIAYKIQSVYKPSETLFSDDEIINPDCVKRLFSCVYKPISTNEQNIFTLEDLKIELNRFQ